METDQMPTPMDDQPTVTSSDHVSSDNVITSDNQSSLTKTVDDQPATPPEVNDTSQSSCSIDDSSTVNTNGEHSDTPTSNSAVVQDMPTSGSGVEQDTPTSGSDTLEQPVSDRMQYLTESCSYDNTNDSLILATPESQSVMEDEQNSNLATTNNNNSITRCLNEEDPLVITRDDPQTNTIEGASLQDDVIVPITSSTSIPKISDSRRELHDRLRALGTEKFPEYLTNLDSYVKCIEDGHLDDDNRKLLTSIIIDTLDYKLICNYKS